MKTLKKFFNNQFTLIAGIVILVTSLMIMANISSVKAGFGGLVDPTPDGSDALKTDTIGEIFLPIVIVRPNQEQPSKVAYIIDDRINKIEEAFKEIPTGDKLPPEVVSKLSDGLLSVNSSGEILLEFHSAQAVGVPEISDLEALGATVEASTADLVWPEGMQQPRGLGIVVAWIPNDKVGEAAELAWVLAVRPVESNGPDAGTFLSEGVILHNADDAQAIGIDGTGVTIGAISDGVTNLAASQALGDLPATVTIPGACPASAGDEGTAMLEIIHDMAPGAGLMFCPTGAGTVGHIAAQNNLVAAGVNVIAEDIPFDSEPAFQKGVVAVNGDTIATAGVSMHSSAGNRGNNHAARVVATGTGGGPDGVAGPFAGCPFTPDNVVAIAPGNDTTFDLSMNPGTTGTTLSVTLQWSEPRAIFPTPGAGGFTDLNLYVMDAALTTCLGSSAGAQGPAGAGDTIEQVSVGFPAGPAVPVKIVVDVQSTGQAAVAPTLDLRWRGGVNNVDAPTRAGSLNPDANYTGLATSSAAANASPVTGSTDPTVAGLQAFSSGGPVQLFLTSVCPGGTYPCPGNVLAGGPGTTRGAPDWTAANGVSVSGVGGFGTPNVVCPATAQGDCLFFGTSASTPHAAACDALVRQKLGGSPSVAVISERLATSVTDRGTAGFDNAWGAGLLDCFRALQEADLTISKSDAPDPVHAGEILHYLITITNKGPDTAADVTVEDILPSEVIYLDDTAGCDTAGLPTLTCSLGDIAVDDSRTFQIEVFVPSDLVANEPDGTAVIINSAEVETATPDPVSANNSVMEGTLIDDQADLQVTKFCKPDAPLQAGETAVCLIVVDNLGPSVSRNVQLSDIHESNGDFNFGVITPSQGTCDPPVGGMIRCDLGNLPPASPSESGRATVEVEITATSAVDINDVATVVGDTPDPDTSNNHAEGGISVSTTADLALTKFDDPDPLENGTTLTYTLEVTNDGPSSAINVVVEDMLPDGVSVVSVNAGGGNCNAGVPGNPLLPTTCTFDTMAPATSEMMTIVVNVDPGALDVIFNDARVFSDVFDPNNSNNLASADTTIQFADLAIVKTSDADIYKPSSTVVYTIDVVNNGPGEAQNVIVTDNLPDNSHATYEFDTGGCTKSGLTLTCDLGTIEAETSKSFNIYVRVKGSQGEVTNTASVTSDIFDPDTGNNSSTKVVLIKGGL
jgi:uncharacterized repeat protein (TIGR01451 family)